MKHHAHMPRPFNICLKKSTTKSLSPRAVAITPMLPLTKKALNQRAKPMDPNLANHQKAPNFRVKRSKPNLKAQQIEENSATQMRKTRNQVAKLSN